MGQRQNYCVCLVDRGAGRNKVSNGVGKYRTQRDELRSAPKTNERAVKSPSRQRSDVYDL